MAESAQPNDRPLEEPRWIAEALGAALHEARLYLETVFAFTLHPRVFAREWVAGTRRAMNPFGVLATSAALMGALGQVAERLILRRDSDPSPLWKDLLYTVTPYAYYAALGAMAHLLLRLSGPTRRLQSTVAMALFAGGGPATMVSLLILGLRAFYQPTGRSLIDAVPPHLKLPVSVLVFGSALQTLHGTSKARTFFSLLGAMLLVGLLLSFANFPVGTLHLRVSLFPSKKWLPYIPVPDLYN